MSFLANVLTEFLTPIIASSSKLVKIIFGLLPIVIAAIMLFFYLSWKPPTVENYYVTDISYSKCYYDKKSDSPKIVLESGQKEYRIYYYIWQISKDEPEVIVSELNKYSQAKIWLSDKDSFHINGIVTPTLSIAPSIGVEWEYSNHKSFLWLIIGSFALGLVATVIILLC